MGGAMLDRRIQRGIRLSTGVALAVLLLGPAPGDRFNTASAQVGGAQMTISMTGPDGDQTFDAYTPAIAFNSTRQRDLVIWTAYTAPIQAVVKNYGQRIDAATGAKIGPGFYISDNRSYQLSPGDHCTPSIAYNSVANEYLVVSRQSEPSNAYQADGRCTGSASRPTVAWSVVRRG